ncbi:MAG: SMP-30/gluconolactonase/LRE family protein [Acidimicrobiia bacterium]|nr:SMP-30/gluconolactonase/LRE family protein [Acidimicrobiia bacterium]
MHADAVRTLDAEGTVGLAATVHHPSGLGWTPDGDLLVTTLDTAVLSRITPDGPQVHCDLSEFGLSLNDMVATPDGRVYVDVYTERGAGAPLGDIVLVAPDGSAGVVASGLVTPNGLVVTPEGTTLVASETFGNKLHAWTIQADGSLADHRVFAELGDRSPDGLCLDVEGGVWVGCFLSGEFIRVLEGGEITDRVPTGESWAVAPALGGPEMRTLYLVVNDTTFMGIATGDSTCRIEIVEVEVPGAGSP